MSRVERFNYITPHRQGMLHMHATGKGRGSKLVCGRSSAAGWQYAMAHSGLPLCSQCQHARQSGKIMVERVRGPNQLRVAA
jgi:hypothetical protein